MLVSKRKTNRQLMLTRQERKFMNPVRALSNEKSKIVPIQRISTCDIDCYILNLLSTGYPEPPVKQCTLSNEEANPQ